MPAEVDPQRWDGLLADLGITDVYYRRGYVEASAALIDASPVFLHHDGAVFPCLLRETPVDVVTPYGYGGPLGAGAGWDAAYEQWCASRGVVSSFVVFHPLFANHDRPGFHVSSLSGTVAWRLEGNLLAGMHGHHRRLVRKAARLGLEATVHAGLGDFVALYEETMRRAGADPFYLFGVGYWAALERGVDLVRVDVRDGEGRLAASVLGMGAPPWLHYHLGASADHGRGAGAPHLALLTLARHGQDHGYEVLHLGGGVGGRDDSLLAYKRRFAPGELRPARIGKAVHDAAAYARLTGRETVDWAGFFPAYRAPR